MENFDIDREVEEWNFANAEPVEQIEYWQLEKIEQLIKSSNFDHDKRQSLETKSKDLTKLEAEFIINMLYDNQLDPITSGTNYGQTEIKRKLSNEI